MLASAMMAGGTLTAADLTVDGTTYTINSGDTTLADSVFVLNGGELLGGGTLEASVGFNMESGLAEVSLSGSSISLTKTTVGNFLLTGSNTYTGDTNVTEGNLQIGDGVSGSISGESDVFIGAAGRLALNLANNSLFSNDVDIAAGGNYVVETSGTTTLSGVISGDGGFFVYDGGSMTGHAILTGANTSTGAYGVEYGTLQIGDGTSGSISALASVYVHDTARLILNLADGDTFTNNIDSGGYIQFDTQGANTLTGIISGTGTIAHEGSGLTILTGAHTYTGNTYVYSGTLQVGDGTTPGASIAQSSFVGVDTDGTLAVYLANGESFTNAVENYGTVESIVNSGEFNTFTNQIIGDGGFAKYGDGTTIFTNSWNSSTQHEYFGGTYIASGELRTDDDGALSGNSIHAVASGALLNINSTEQEVGMLIGGGDVDLGFNGDLWVGNSSSGSGTFGGNIIGEGHVHYDGSGIWSITGNNDFYGDLFVERGAVRLTGTLYDAQVIVEQDGFFFGTGRIARDLYNDGGVAAGIGHNYTGTLTIDDDFRQYSTGTLYTQVASSSKYGKLAIGDEADLAGSLVLVPIKGYQAKRSDRLTVLTSGTVIGKFEKFESLLPETMLTAKLDYSSTSVVIEFEQGKFGDLKGLTPNEKAVGKGLDRVNTKRSLNSLFDKLNVIAIDDVPDVLALLSPEQYAAIFNIGFASSQVQFNNLERRLSDVRNGATGFSTNGLALSNSRGTLNYNGAPIVNERDGLSLAGFDGKSIVSKQTVAPIITESRWSFFVTGQGEWADVESTQNALGSEFTTGGVSIGADYRVNDNFVVGLTGNYTNTGSDLNDGGKITVNGGRGAVYASVFGNGLYGNAVVGGGYNSYDLKRATFGGNASGDTDGGQFDALLGGGYDYKIGAFTVGPIASLQYTYLGLNSFTETGSNAPLSFTSQNQDSLKSTLGLKASYAFNVGGVKITPEVRAQWLHEYLDSTAAIESSFAAGASAFTVDGPNIGRDGILFDAGVSAQFTEAFSVFAYYTGDYGRTNYTSNVVNGGVRVAF